MRKEMPTQQSMLVGISGIDASGKGYIASKLSTSLPAELNVAVVNADGWLNLPEVRFSESDPARHFFENALRLDEMFEKLILPVKRNSKVDITADLVEETSTGFHSHRYVYDCIDVILVEGIFLFKPDYLNHFNLRIWVECGFETALARAVARSQEGLDRQQTVGAYENIYFPAQRLHFAIDRPKSFADIMFYNN